MIRKIEVSSKVLDGTWRLHKDHSLNGPTVSEKVINRPTQEQVGNAVRTKANQILHSYDSLMTVHTVLATARAAEDLLDIRRSEHYAKQESAEFMRQSLLQAAEHQVASASSITPITRYVSSSGITETSMFGERSNYIQAKSYEKAIANYIGADAIKECSIPYNQIFTEALHGNIDLKKCLDDGKIGGLSFDNGDERIREAFTKLDHLANENRMGALFDNGNLSALAETATFTSMAARKAADELTARGYTNSSGITVDFTRMTHADFAAFNPDELKMSPEDIRKYNAIKDANNDSYQKILDTASSFSCDRTSLSDVTRQLDAYSDALTASLGVSVQKKSTAELKIIRDSGVLTDTQKISVDTMIGLRETQKKLDDSYVPISKKMQVKIANTDFSNIESVEKLKKAFTRYGRLHGVSGLNNDFDLANASEAENVLAFALSMKDERHLDKQIKSLEKSIANIVGSEQLKAEGFSKALFGAIANGTVDVDKILENGVFCGKDIRNDTEFQDAITALKMYATASAINEEQSIHVISALMKRPEAMHDADTLALCKYFDKLQADSQIDLSAALTDSLKDHQGRKVIKSLDDLKGMSFKDMPIEVIQAIDVKKLTEKLPKTTQKEIARAEMIEKRLENQLKPQLDRNKSKAERLTKRIGLDLNSIKSVQAHSNRLAAALNLSSETGMKWIRKHSKFKDFRTADIKTLTKLLKSKAGKKLTIEEKTAIQNLLGYKKHLETLRAKSKFQRNTRMRLKRGFLRASGLGQTDLIKGIQFSRRFVATTRQVLRAARAVGRMAYKPFKPLVMHMTRGVRMRFNAASEAAKSLSERLKATVKQKAKELADKEKKAAGNVLDKLKNKVLKGDSKASKVIEKTTGIFKKRKQIKKEKAAAKRQKKNLVPGNKKSIFAFFNSVKAIAVKVGVIVAGCLLASYFCGVLIQAVLTPLIKLDDWLSDIQNFRWFWEPKEATEEQKEALLPSVINLLKEEEEHSDTVSYWISQYDMSGSAFYSWVDPLTGERTKLSPKNELTNEDLLTPMTTRFYSELGEDGRQYVGTQYSTIKLVVSMAHAFTLPIQTEDDLRVFQEYCVGLWHYINQYQVVGELECTPATTKSLLYSCSKDAGTDKIHGALYDRSYNVLNYGQIISEYLTQSNEDTIKAVASNKYVAVVAGPVAETNHGCLYRVFNALTSTAHTYRLSDGKYIGSMAVTTGKLSHFSSTSSYFTKVLSNSTQENNPFRKCVTIDVLCPVNNGWVHKTNRIYYTIDPIIAQNCATEEFNCITSGNDQQTSEKSAAARTILSGTTFCTENAIDRCSNKAVYYCAGCQYSDVTYCSDASQTVTVDGAKIEHTGFETLPCDNCDHFTVYQCKGHSVYSRCSGYNLSVADMNGTVFAGLATSPKCQHAQVIKIKTSQVSTATYYYCAGYDTVTYCFSGYSRIKPTSCDSYSQKELYVCNGHNTVSCPGHTVCLGHCTESVCDHHEFCPGHSLSYCTGELRYQFTKTILAGGNLSDPSCSLYNDWHYDYNLTLKKRLLESEARVIKVHFSSESLSEALSDPFAGWDQDTIEIMLSVFGGDWYSDYGSMFDSSKNIAYGSDFWEGGTVSESEKRALFNEFNVDNRYVSEQRINVIAAALNAVGQIPYQPGGIVSPNATFNSLISMGFGDAIAPREYVTEGGICYRIKGLAKYAFADYAFFNGTAERNTSLIPFKNPELFYELIPRSKTDLRNYGDFDKLQPGDILIHYQVKPDGTVTCDDTQIVIGYHKGDNTSGTTYHIKTVGMGTYWAQLKVLNITTNEPIPEGLAVLRDVYS